MINIQLDLNTLNRVKEKINIQLPLIKMDRTIGRDKDEDKDSGYFHHL